MWQSHKASTAAKGRVFDAFKHEYGLPDGYFRTQAYLAIIAAQRGTSELYSGRVLADRWSPALTGGKAMEETGQMLQETNRQLLEANAALQALATQLATAAEILQSQLATHVQGVRAARMTVVNEVRDMLTALRDVRTFFLESNYEAEPKERLGLCAQALRTTLRRMAVALGDPSYNFIVHSNPLRDLPTPSYHWHIEVMPALSQVAAKPSCGE